MPRRQHFDVGAGVPLDELDSVIREHSASANRFYSDMAGKRLSGSVGQMNLIDPSSVAGREVMVHGHAPASRAAHLAAARGELPHPVNVFSVLTPDRKVLGQVTGITVEDVHGAIDRGQLRNYEEDVARRGPNASKTRNTFVGGVVTGHSEPAPRGAKPLGVKPGKIFVPGEEEPLWDAPREAGAPTVSDTIGRKASLGAGSAPDRPSAWILPPARGRRR